MSTASRIRAYPATGACRRVPERSPRGGGERGSCKSARTAWDLALCLGAVYLREVEISAAGVLGSDSTEPLHDLRVGARRLRMVLRLFRPMLSRTSAWYAEDAVKTMCGRLGPARDADVWLDFLSGTARSRAWASDPARPAFLRNAVAARSRRRSEVRAFLRSETFLRTCRVVERVFDADAARIGEQGRAPARRLAGRLLLRAYRRLPCLALPCGGMAASELHEVRRRCRRARYAAEFFGPVVGRNGVELERRLHAVADALGTIHDMDMHLESLGKGRGGAPATLVAAIRKCRLLAVKDLACAWPRLRKQAFAAALKRECAKAMRK